MITTVFYYSVTDKIHSRSLRASWCVPVGPLHNMKETAPWRCAFVFIVFALLASELAVRAKTIKNGLNYRRDRFFHIMRRGQDSNLR